MYDDQEDPFPAPAPYQVPKDAKKIKERIRRYERALEQEKRAEAKHGDALAGIFAFRHSRAEEIHQQLRAKNIHVMSHAGRLRVALHGYNTMDDVSTLLALLREMHPPASRS